MRDLAFVPGGGLQGLPIGASKDEVRAFFGGGHQPFTRTPDEKTADCWPTLGVFAYFTPDERLEALEFSDPARPTLNGSPLLGLELIEAIALLRMTDTATEVEAGSAISRQLCISLWRSTDEMEQPVMAALTFAPGYYD